jgi:hypothetical protein
MPADKRDILAVLKTELSYLEAGGYAREEQNPWRPALAFEDSPSCPNYHGKIQRQSCDECALAQLVPEAQRNTKRPCRFIPLNDLGQTVGYFDRYGTQNQLEWNLMAWLRKTIRRLENERGMLGDQKWNVAYIKAPPKQPSR